MSESLTVESRKNQWEVKALGELFETLTGTTPSKSNASYYGDFIPFIKPPELNNSYLEASLDNLSELGMKEARVLPINSVLVSCIGYLGKIGINCRKH